MDALENVYGKASGSGFGSAVFHEAAGPGENSENTAMEHYKKFLGPKWNEESQRIWMKPWKKVYHRKLESQTGIVTELASIADTDAKRSIGLLTEFIPDPAAGIEAMASAFDHRDVKDLSIFSIGDGEAMSGIMVTAIYSGSYCCSVIALME